MSDSASTLTEREKYHAGMEKNTHLHSRNSKEETPSGLSGACISRGSDACLQCISWDLEDALPPSSSETTPTKA